MTVLLDTNIIMDALQERTPFDAPAKEILLRGQNGEYTCMFTASAATDIFFMYSKARDIPSAKAAVDFLLRAYMVVSVTHEDCIAARRLPIDDFEDGLVAACAKKASADYIVTRDNKLLQMDFSIKRVAPDEFVALITC